MYLIAIAWIYVVFMMAVVEATAANGTVLGAIITFIFYGLVPCGIVMYLLGAPMRRKAINAKEREELEALRAQATAHAAATQADGSNQPNSSGESAADAITPMRKEP
jgi:hypothetical protein